LHPGIQDRRQREQSDRETDRMPMPGFSGIKAAGCKPGENSLARIERIKQNH
jgi:hypothetical protein